ncbi:hypothetical protein CYMTET_8675 [Cymbomonas tetramitiformis]|uniref:Uncharacterized protein n=1 Tax=Cymbomonas tetramitiformis TaxID=36881 RepID=A0AAE0GTB3_9CHLO|nr:hypothetical protein CYMTET_8675 [Cymbomonas tetramitiformis]
MRLRDGVETAVFGAGQHVDVDSRCVMHKPVAEAALKQNHTNKLVIERHRVVRVGEVGAPFGTHFTTNSREPFLAFAEHRRALVRFVGTAASFGSRISFARKIEQTSDDKTRRRVSFFVGRIRTR